MDLRVLLHQRLCAVVILVVIILGSNGGVEVVAAEDLSPSATAQMSQCKFDKLRTKYHLDTVCDRAADNRYKDSLNRALTHKKLMPTGVSRVLNEETIHCPEQVHDLSSSNEEDDAMEGFDAIWILENTATTPVVVGWVKDGVEYSAYNAHITPPNLDPSVIIQPGQWKSFMSFEGHVFHVRSILEDGSLGPVLLQHRLGLIPIRNRYGPTLICDPNNEPDPEPIIDEETNEIDPQFARGKPEYGKPCNTLDVGFRNEVGCPLHGYYSGMQSANITTGDATCKEEFKFHLGLNPRPNDFLWDWESQTKYECSYIGHNFVFRLAKDPSILVDQVQLQPTFVSDCPNLKQKDMLKTSMEVTSIGTFQRLSLNSTTTTTTTTTNATAGTIANNAIVPLSPLRPTSLTSMNTFNNNNNISLASSYYFS